MRFDTVIIGGGLAGLICGIRLAKQGERCAIVSLGHSALHFSSGSLELLGALPDGTAVVLPSDALVQLRGMAPQHPYARFDSDRFLSLADEGRSLLQKAGIGVYGTAEHNHYRLTPVGAMKPAWLTFEGYVHSDKSDKLPWQSVALFNAEGFLDFYPQFLRDEMLHMGTKCRVYTFNLKELEQIRQNPTEMRSANIARIFDSEQTLDALAKIIAENMGDAEAVLLPAVLGIDNRQGVTYLEQKLGRKVAVIATLPPSVPGLQVQTLLRRRFQQLGGVYMLGDTAVGYTTEGDKIVAVNTKNHGNIGFRADNFVLATGSFFSGGLEATMQEVREPLFDVDVEFDAERNAWYERDMFKAQPYQSYGLKSDNEFHAMRGGRACPNLYVVGAGLAGFNAIKQGCGAGVSMLTAISVADTILSKR
jgi:glycerol-3-phosphate dehydrogenase subunit B